uniref:DNA polymerase epsilon catalytic subunit A n=1 Tax=Lygus hesperus TaxID=30085 RepID=A0A0A9W7M8_LYGHE
MIVLQNLPLTYSVRDIIDTVSKYGTIVVAEIFRNHTKAFYAKNSFTKKVSPYFAHIYFRDAESVAKILTKSTERFGITIQKQAVYPIHSSKHISLLLTNLPHDVGSYTLKNFLRKETDNNVTGFDIRSIIFKRNIYDSSKYAHIEFTTHEAADTVYRSLLQNQ